MLPPTSYKTLQLQRLRSPLVFRALQVSSDSQSNPAQFCLEAVKRTDHEHFLTNLLLPPRIKTDSFALRAFSSEVANVRESVSERTLGQVRLQFWRDTIDRLYDDLCPQHPVAIQLYRIIKQKRPSRQLFHNIISSREKFLSDQPFSSLEEVEQYGEEAFSSVYLLLLECLGNSNGHIKHAATQLGQSEALVTLLRALPYNAAKRRCYLPSDLLLERDVSTERVLRAGGGDHLDQEIREVVELLAGRAEQHLQNCRFRAKYLTREEKLLLLPAVGTDHYLTSLSKVQCNPWHKSLHQRNSWLPLSLYWHKFRQSY